jgi:tRNA 2-thiouridine synthesizing protein A
MSPLPIRPDAEREDGPTPEAAIIVDARGHRCPTPTLRLRRALEAAAPDASLVLLSDDPLARIDVPHFLATAGYAPPIIAEVEGGLRITVRKRRDGGSFGKVFPAIS